jgi:3-dehydroquinate synthase/shikimate kinase/3-dehydroquinate synthase
MIVLVGFMGAGKTTVGRLLAERLDVPFVDADEAVVTAEGRSIPEIFTTDGEAAFRRIEAETIAALLAGPEAVLALGGGALGSENVRRALAGHRVVLLDIDLADALARVGGDESRPMLRRPDLAEVYRSRQRAYRDTAEAVVPAAGRTPDEVVTDLLSRLTPPMEDQTPA